jgi:hypothetical protein
VIQVPIGCCGSPENTTINSRKCSYKSKLIQQQVKVNNAAESKLKQQQIEEQDRTGQDSAGQDRKVKREGIENFLNKIRD